ncbi:RNA-binding protein musashi/mRNA cleavage and polyadenylation factor I complex, subunit HRP1 [Ceraceosorus bombacis]|uniref:RNA-binding protein musashi/mRNA cleavage and polyadenylation factor I complex, subunit HRP1 n=1 Tax=Ceraceosorus bombacis TaxID=401625 RepID=A0A0P1BLL3_9BASI|nr:RNA-binding protein musashi/mRNA cleavage and polyadenylation factor I complex, subunit HRP1 [Ceraceosorus bombacis]
MAPNDPDDLYSDLYGEEGDIGANVVDEQNHTNNDDIYGSSSTANKSGPDSSATTHAQSTTSRSFIPPPPSGKGAGSFIPPDPKKEPLRESATPVPVPVQAAIYNDNARIQSTQSAVQRVSQPDSTTNTSGTIHRVMPHEMPDDGKMFVGGLSWDTTDEALAKHFSQYGKVTHCTIMREPGSGRSRGFAFLRFADPSTVNVVMVKEHFLDGKLIDPKRAVPRGDSQKTLRCFVGSIPQTATSESFRRTFEPFGEVTESNLMMDNQTGRPRGYGFVSFTTEESAERLLASQPLYLDGKQIEVKKAQPRSDRNADNGRRTNVRDVQSQRDAGSSTGGDNSSSLPTGIGMGMTNGGAFDPQAMAQFFQQTGWGNNFNPMMFQQMMMGGAMGGMPGMMGGMGMPGMMGMPNMGGMGMQGGYQGQMGQNGMGGGGGGGDNYGHSSSWGQAGAGCGNANGRSTHRGSPMDRATGSGSRDGDRYHSSSAAHDQSRGGRSPVPPQTHALPRRPEASLPPRPNMSARGISSSERHSAQPGEGEQLNQQQQHGRRSRSPQAREDSSRTRERSPRRGGDYGQRQGRW